MSTVQTRTVYSLLFTSIPTVKEKISSSSSNLMSCPDFSPAPGALWASQVAQMVKCLPAMWETQVRSLGQEDPLEKEMATHSSVLAWRIPGTGEPGGLQSMGLQRIGRPKAT